ncbi:MAG TPA: hypothetical protein VHE30_25170 [Polyangiaceae bacterium]|nr:hypothetical protein [Polyangiaceae bacterium]
MATGRISSPPVPRLGLVADRPACLPLCKTPLAVPPMDAVWALRTLLLRNPLEKLPDTVKYRAELLPRPYQDGPDFANDELGYGEEIDVGLYPAPNADPKDVRYCHGRRTKTGGSPWRR